MELGSSTDDVRTSVLHHDHEKDDEKQHHFHVLAVDDSLIDRKLLERLLTVSSYQVTCVDSGDKALEYLGLLGIDQEKEYESSPKLSQQEESKINMIMTDYSMPGITGYDLLKRIKGSSWKNVPVVVMSSEDVPSRISMCLEGGAQEFLLKPVKPSDLEKLHSHLLKHSHSSINIGEEDNGIDITIDHEIKVVCSKEDSITNTNKRKTFSSTTSDVSERRAQAQELSVS